MQLARAIVSASVTLAAVSCDVPPGARELHRRRTDSTTATGLPSAAARWRIQGDLARGRALYESFECGRCHAHDGAPAVAASRDCAGCHRAIAHGTYARDGVSPELATTFREHVESLVAIPRLDDVDGWLSRDWLAAWLIEPTDLRPHLDDGMPRLDLEPADAADLATFLVPSAPLTPARQPAGSGEIARGAQLALELGCPGCHAMGDEWPVPADAPALAPDLVHVRGRLERETVTRFLVDPRAVRPRSSMPALVSERAAAEAIVAFLFEEPVAPRPPLPDPPRLPILERAVTFGEVQERVLRRSCWHCHADESLAYGDGGPGNTGGFGFAAREVDLSSYAHVMAGGLDDAGQRASLFRDVGGEPMFLRVLLARADEERGYIDPEVRGMPLGLNALDPEQIQLVESWIAQGRSR